MKSCSRLILQVILFGLLIFCFLLQMWKQFNKFLKRQTTVAVSFEQRKTQKLPTFAFCDSRAYKTEIPIATTAAGYNESTYDIESEVSGEILEIVMPMDRSYHVFLLEDGEALSLVIQYFVSPPPSFIVASDTNISLYNTITRIDQDCEIITSAQLQQCIKEGIKDKIQSLNMSCLPFQVHYMFPALQKLYQHCKNDTMAFKYYTRVSW